MGNKGGKKKKKTQSNKKKKKKQPSTDATAPGVPWQAAAKRMTNKCLGRNQRPGGGGPQQPFGSRVSPAPFPPAAPAPPVVSPAPALTAGGADLRNCPTCLEPLRPADPARQRAAFWRGCRHPYHFACLARTVAGLPDPACSLCRAPWPEGAAPELIDACTALAVNPFLDSDAGSRPPTPRANAAHAAPAVPVDSSSGSGSDAPCPPEPLPQQLPWARRGPPLCPVQGAANSWLYVPLLWAAAGDMPAATLAAWRAATPTDDWWETSRAQLAASGPVSLARLTAALAGTPSPGAATSAARLTAAAARLPSAAQAHLPWAVRHLAGPDGYVEAAGQEVCLQLYGGLALATRLNTASDFFRASTVPAPAAAVPPARRRPRRRRDPPRPSNAPAAPSVPVPASDDEASPAAPARTLVGSISDASWAWLDTVDLTAEFRAPVPTIRTLPPFLHSPAIRAYLIPLRVIASTTSAAQASRAWTLFLLTPRLLFARSGTAGRRTLLNTAHQAAATPDPPRLPSTQPAAARRRARACAQVRTGDLSRARQTLTNLPLAPGTAATHAALRDPARRPPTLLRPIPEEVQRAAAPPPTRFSAQIVADALRSAKRGSAAGLSGSTTDHYKALFADEEALDLLAVAVTRLAAADLPASALAALRLPRLTALQKPDGGVRGIATGDAFRRHAFRRLASRVLARHYAATFDRLTRPFQYALQARAGTDALAGLLRASLETDPGTVVVNIDGRAAYDTVSRATVLSQVSALIGPFLAAVRPSFLWQHIHLPVAR